MYPQPNLLRCCIFCISKFCVFFTFFPKKKAINCFFLTKRGRGNPRREPESGRQKQSQTPATYRGRAKPGGNGLGLPRGRTNLSDPGRAGSEAGQARRERLGTAGGVGHKMTDPGQKAGAESALCECVGGTRTTQQTGKKALLSSFFVFFKSLSTISTIRVFLKKSFKLFSFRDFFPFCSL